jgi:hypothetical protein
MENHLDKALAQVAGNRRGFLKNLLIGAGAAAVAVPLISTQSMAQKEGEDPVDGKCDPGLVIKKGNGKCSQKKKKADGE